MAPKKTIKPQVRPGRQSLFEPNRLTVAKHRMYHSFINRTDQDLRGHGFLTERYLVHFYHRVRGRDREPKSAKLCDQDFATNGIYD
ncbi:hypothetical protein Forpe1208_v015291 [Fusarium oxysporum f. sp. rapae]|uniref:Uncharacterized protein n=1 Tax=Fusarium oxysporum f. sp. rapae TaxID=485398 RepID=A0A8J5NKM8_FUSOX|nr:hypothetical protein Forpe1208_v015291 [Fusarium oxysporum f. sp. rapae]